MVESWDFWVTVFLGLLIVHYLKQLWTSRNYPPGPFQLPLIGGILRIGTGLSHNILIKLAEEYGKIYTLWLGHQPIVVVSGFEAVKEVLVDHSDDFTGRPVSAFVKIGLEKSVVPGILFSSGDIWKQHRRFGLVTLRKMGVGKKLMESQIEMEAKHLVESFACTKGQPCDPMLPITNAVSNVICALAYGYRFSPEDEVFKEKLKSVDYITKNATSVSSVLYETFPWLMQHLPGSHQKLLEILKKEISFAMMEIEKHREHQDKYEPQDIIDFYLLQMEKSKNDPTSTYSDDNLAQFINDLLIAGTETSATSLQWALLLMVSYPDIQDKVYKEIEEVLASSESFSYQDHKKLPYTNAVIHEVLRARYILLFGLPRECVKDVTIRGFHIPKGTFIISDLRSVLLDPEHWETPEKFNPHHFLDKDGHFIAGDEFLPFGAGARLCLGDQLAKMEMFLFFTHLLRIFKFQLPEGVKALNTEPIFGFTLHPHPYKICAVPRST
uniref:Cytochrome P450 family 2 subfamily J member 2 n=1 Tax=Anolis carolinensis TaxID=28377 RepID=A0A803SP26_ANOCA